MPIAGSGLLLLAIKPTCQMNSLPPHTVEGKSGKSQAVPASASTGQTKTAGRLSKPGRCAFQMELKIAGRD
jgi:hypothetical protein